MTFSYQSTLEDKVEASFRYFVRGPTAQLWRIKSAFYAAIVAGAIVFFGNWAINSSMTRSISSFAVAVVVAAAFGYFTYFDTVRSRLRRHFKLLASEQPTSETRYTVAEGKLICLSDGVEISFPLSSLSLVSEDKTRLEVEFGKAGLCVIPLRAFESPQAKDEFVKTLKEGRNT